MAERIVTVRVVKRWHFWLVVPIIVLLGRIGILRDQEKAGRWIADHVLRLEVE